MTKPKTKEIINATCDHCYKKFFYVRINHLRHYCSLECREKGIKRMSNAWWLNRNNRPKILQYRLTRKNKPISQTKQPTTKIYETKINNPSRNVSFYREPSSSSIRN